MLYPCEPRSEKAAQLEEALGNLAQESRNEPGSLIYEVHRSASDRDEYFLYQIWRSQTDLEAHMKAVAMLAFLGKEPELVNGAVNLCLFTPVDIIRILARKSPPDDRWAAVGVAEISIAVKPMACL